FREAVRYEPRLGFFGHRKTEQRVARFRKINSDNPHAHHDALEFPDREVVLLTNLLERQRATVLQLPAPPPVKAAAVEQELEPASCSAYRSKSRETSGSDACLRPRGSRKLPLITCNYQNQLVSNWARCSAFPLGLRSRSLSPLLLLSESASDHFSDLPDSDQFFREWDGPAVLLPLTALLGA